MSAAKWGLRADFLLRAACRMIRWYVSEMLKHLIQLTQACKRLRQSHGQFCEWLCLLSKQTSEKNVTGNATATADVTTVSHWMSSGDSNWLTPSCLRKMIIFLDVLVHEIENRMFAMPALLQVNKLALGFSNEDEPFSGS